MKILAVMPALDRADFPASVRASPAPVHRHLDLYAFTRAFLAAYTRLTPTDLEKREQLEQLRALEQGRCIRVSLVDQPIQEVNTPEDLQAAEDIIRREQPQGEFHVR